MAGLASAPSSKFSRAVDRALAAYRAGQLDEAEAICEKILVKKRDFFDAVHLLGVIQSMRGRYELALATLGRALAVQPNNAQAHNNRGNAFKKMGWLDEALASYDRAIAIQQDFAVAFNNRGTILQEQRQFDAAIVSLERAIALNPRYFEAHYNRATVLHDLKRFEEALASHDRALGIRHFAEGFARRASTLSAMDRHEEALASCERALALAPDHIDALDKRGTALRGLKRFDESLADFARLLSLQPNHAVAHNNRGNTFRDMIRLEDALESYSLAISLRPNFVNAITNLALILRLMGRFKESMEAAESALVLEPELDAAHFVLSTGHLLLGDLRSGFREYEWRWKGEEMLKGNRNFTQPLWLGEQDLSGKTILLHAEQGFGDTIQFCRYAPLVEARGAKIILEVQKPLQSLMSTLAGSAHVIGRGDALPAFDLHCPLLSLPLAFDTQIESIPSAAYYLKADPQASAVWDARLGPKRSPRVGLVWSGNPDHKRDRERSMPLSALAPLLEIDATFVSLHKDVRPSDIEAIEQYGILKLGSDVSDFADTAALISQLDLVISVDTSVAHLAGALGTPVWIMVTQIPDWRWMLGRDDTPWYPSARLFRQQEAGQWPDAIRRVRAALAGFGSPSTAPQELDAFPRATLNVPITV